MSTPDGTSRTESRNRGGWGRKAVVALGIVVGLAALAFGGLVYLVLQTSTEEVVAMRAEDINESKGTVLDEITRLGEAEARGTTLKINYTLTDDWAEKGIKRIVDRGGTEPTIEAMLELLSDHALGIACDERAELGRPELVVVMQYSDERGTPIYGAEASRERC